MRRFTLNPQRRQRLRRQLAQTRDLRLYRRTLAVLEFDRGRPAAGIAQMLGVTRQSVHNWVAAFADSQSPAALADAARTGRPRLLDGEGNDLLEALLAFSPQELGFPDVNWTVPLLREALEQGTGRRASCDTVRRRLRALDYVWKRPRYVLAPDPQREKKTAGQAADPGPAAAQRGAGRGRDRPAALPAAARRLVPARGGGGRPAERPERPARYLRGDEPAHWGAGVRAPAEGPQRGLPGVRRRGALGVPGVARGAAAG